MANTLSTVQWAPLQDGDGNNLFPSSFAAVSADPAIAAIGTGTDGVIAVVGKAAGTTTVTASRHSDGATASVDVTVTATVPGDFTIQLGTPVNV